MTLRARGVVTAALAAALSLVVVAGCGQNEEPKPLENDPAAQDNAPDDQQQGGEDGDSTPPPDSGDQEASPGEGGTTPPGGGKVEQQEGDVEPVDPGTASEIEALVLQFASEYDKAMASGDMAEVQKLYTDSCKECAQAVRNIKDVYDRGGRYVGGNFIQPKVQVEGRKEDGSVSVKLIAKSTAYKVLDSSGKVVESEPEQQDDQGFTVTEADGGWRISWWI